MEGSKTADHLRLAATRCLGVLKRYHDGERTAARREMMGLEVGMVAAWLLELRVPADAAVDDVLGPVEAGLLARYGHEAGPRINGEFVEAFERWGMDLLIRSRGVEIGAATSGLRGRGA